MNATQEARDRAGRQANAPSAPLCVRAAERADIGQLLPLWRDMMASHLRYHESFALAADAAEAWRQSMLDMVQRHDSFVLLAERRGHVAGFCSGWVAYNPPIYEARVLGLISEIVVAAPAQRLGVGSALLSAARSWFAAREITEFQLSTAVQNEGAQRFWRRQGGEPLLVRYRFDAVAPSARTRLVP